MVKHMEKKNKRSQGCLTLCVASRGRGCQWELAGTGQQPQPGRVPGAGA
jgi:hypothetical protein